MVTAEGAIDEQTLMGKGTGQVARLCQRLDKPCIGLAGQLTLGKAQGNQGEKLFSRLAAMVPDLTGEREAMAYAATHLQRLANQEAKLSTFNSKISKTNGVH